MLCSFSLLVTEEIETVICNQNDPSELIQITDTVSIIMFILLPFVSGYSP